MFIQVASKSNFPQITTMAFTDLCNKFKVVDKNLLKLAWIETQVISATSNDIKFESGNKI